MSLAERDNWPAWSATMTREPDLPGVLTALVTPFRDGALDEAAMVNLVERQIVAGIHGVLVASHLAGEAAALSPDETLRVVELCVEAADGRMQIVADTSSNATATAIALTADAFGAGADYALVSAPWYNRPGQAGLFEHFKTVAAAARIPLLLANAPRAACIDILPETAGRLAALPGVVGLIEDSAEASRFSDLRQSCGPEFKLLADRDVSALGAMAHGARGLVSVAANLAPKAVLGLHRAWSAGHWSHALQWNDRLAEFNRLAATDGSCVAAKAALASLGLCSPDVRLPMIAGLRALDLSGVDAALLDGLMVA
jgi:4-hydroxy-tetrahydrodipicolinate synthase